MVNKPKSAKRMRPQAPRKPNLLVIGDWVIDDSWVIGPHKSDTSTFTGQQLYRSLHHAGSVVKRHCGAGRAAAILRVAKWKKGSYHTSANIHGLGLWAPSDTEEYLYRAFTPEGMLGGNCYRMVPTQDHALRLDDVHLKNLADVLACLAAPNAHTQYKAPSITTTPTKPFIKRRAFDAADVLPYVGTTRVFRFYRRSLGSLTLLNRIDWELPAQSSEGHFASWLPDWQELKVQTKAIAEFKRMMENLGKIDAVIIKDNGKGVVSSSLIDLLLAHCGQVKDVPWFVQTKRWDPGYLSQLRQAGINVCALVYHGVALAQHKEVYTWLTAQHRPSPEAIKQLDDIAVPLNNKAPRHIAVLLTGPLSAIAVERKRDGTRTVFAQPMPNPNGIPLEGAIGSATAFFTALVFSMMHGDESVAAKFVLDGALRVAQHWIRTEYNRLIHPQKLAAPEELVLNLTRQSEPAETQFTICLTIPKGRNGATEDEELDSAGNVNEIGDIVVEKYRWHAALSGCGVIREKGAHDRLELYRSTIELPNFVCCAPSKRRQIAMLKAAIAGFRPGHRSISGLLTAQPGSGKTTLVHGLAADPKVHLRSINLTNITRIDDLLSCFDQVVTEQLENRDKTLLVFVDEINAKVAGHYVYEAFLTPLEDGYYVRRGNKRHIFPCVWLFVGTSTIEKIIASNSKGSDFASRMTLEHMNIGEVPLDEKAYLWLENVYVGAFVARNEFPGLMTLHREVLQVLASFATRETKTGVAPCVPHREIKRLIGRELAVDGLGNGKWRDAEALRRKLLDQCKIDPTLLDINERLLAGKNKWINVRAGGSDWSWK